MTRLHDSTWDFLRQSVHFLISFRQIGAWDWWFASSSGLREKLASASQTTPQRTGRKNDLGRVETQKDVAFCAASLKVVVWSPDGLGGPDGWFSGPGSMLKPPIQPRNPATNPNHQLGVTDPIC